MLKQLYIKNFTLIDTLDMEFRSGFSVITGETGAGKSIILGAIGLLLGQRADSKSVKMGTDKCVIEAHFDLSRYGMERFFDENEIEFDAEDTIIRRELTSAGKSRAFINDTPVALSMLKELGEQLVDVHSQHQNLLLNKQDFQLNVVDIIADDAKELTDYQQTYVRYQELKKEEQRLHEDIEQGRIKTALYEAESALSGDEGGVVSNLKKAVSALQGIEHVYPDVAELAERMNSCYIELKDAAAEVSGKMDDVDFDPAELDMVNTRLDRIYELQKKYKVERVDQLLAIQEELGRKLSNIENSDEALAEIERQVSETLKDARRKAELLTEKRRVAAGAIEKQMRERLVPLGMPNVRFEIAVEQEPLGRCGQDKVSFLFSANTSTPLQPVSQVASGGEIARVMLSLKAMISGAVKLPTIIFDEIDTGVSGKIAEQMARMMSEMGHCDRQVISITHLPQIAALGSTHYKVYKDETAQGTTTHMLMLNDEERVREIAQMLSGSDVSEAAIQNAKELLKL